MADERFCVICGTAFTPNKYRPNQNVCSSLECQYQRQLNNMKKWRDRNPNYFKYKESQKDNGGIKESLNVATTAGIILFNHRAQGTGMEETV